MFRAYFSLTKPGIILGNAITAAGGFLLASKGLVDYHLFAAMIIGLSLVIASACVFNNYLDRDIDAKMARTKKRALVKHLISDRNAITFAAILGIAGDLVLTFYTNLLTMHIALAGFFFYVIVYSLWAKRHTEHGTLLGSVSGAIPPVAGYTAVTNSLDIGAGILFLILVLWQMPHFYAIAIYRMKDYSNASIPVLPIKRGIYATKVYMLLYIIAFTLAAVSLTAFGYAGYIYALAAAVLGVVWLGMGVTGFDTKDSKLWARRMFLFSLLIITLLCIMMGVDPATAPLLTVQV